MPKKLIFAITFLACANFAHADNYGPFSCQNLGNSCASSNWNASAFNIVTLGGVAGDANSGNYAASSDVGGGIAVFKNLTNTGSPIDSQDTTIVNPYTSLNSAVINGQITYGGKLAIGNNHQESIYCAASVSNCNSSNFNPTLPVINATEGFDFLGARTALQKLSTQTLATAAATTVAAYSVDVTTKASGTYIYNVDASYFGDQNNGFTVNLKGSGQTVIVNITNAPVNFSIPKGTVINYGGSQVGQTTSGGVPVLFNLVSSSTTTINAGGQFNGSLLAPYATFTGGASVDGQLIIASLNNSGEIHDQYFTGSLPAAAVPSPEPSTWMMSLTGIYFFAVLLKRKLRSTLISRD